MSYGRLSNDLTIILSFDVEVKKFFKNVFLAIEPFFQFDFSYYTRF
ncbi:hypothetical protein STFR1_50436 [Bacillus vallismortis]